MYILYVCKIIYTHMIEYYRHITYIYISWYIRYYDYEPCVYISYIYIVQAHCRYLYIIKTSYRHNIALHYLHYADTGQPGLGDKLALESTPAIPHAPWHIHTIGKDWKHVEMGWHLLLFLYIVEGSLNSGFRTCTCELEFHPCNVSTQPFSYIHHSLLE